jgi:hypothetical protein
LLTNLALSPVRRSFPKRAACQQNGRVFHDEAAEV